MAKYLIDSTDIEIEEVSGTENLKFNLAPGNSAEQMVGDLSNLTTTNKSNLVNAINEVDGNIKSFLQLSSFTLSIGAISSQDGLYDQSYTITIPTGYIPIGIVGVNTNGPNSATLTIPKMYIASNKILYSVFNTSNRTTTDATTSINVSVLFVKNL